MEKLLRAIRALDITVYHLNHFDPHTWELVVVVYEPVPGLDIPFSNR
jgi:hypothetical protein